MKTEPNAQLYQAALDGDPAALEIISRNPQAVRELQALRAAQPWVEQLARDAARKLRPARQPADVLAWLRRWLQPAVLAPATAFAAAFWLVSLPGLHGDHPPGKPGAQATSAASAPAQAPATRPAAPDRLFANDFDRPAARPVQARPQRGDALFNGDFEKNS